MTKPDNGDLVPITSRMPRDARAMIVYLAAKQGRTLAENILIMHFERGEISKEECERWLAQMGKGKSL